MYDIESRQQDGVPQAGRPSLLWTVAEVARLPVELGWSYAYQALRPRREARTRRVVLVLPGFLATDAMTARLRAALELDGHHVEPAGLGRMVGLTDAVLDGLLARVDELERTHGQPVTVIGWSFGGLLARWAAHQRPGLVEHVVTLGSPWRADGEVTQATGAFHRAAEKHGISARAQEVIATLRTPVPVPVTALYSHTDGVVPWQSCRAEESADTENIAVPSSHVGLVCNPLVLGVIGDRLFDAPLNDEFRWTDWLPGPLADIVAPRRTQNEEAA